VIGTQAGANAAPDGYTFLLATSSTFSVNRYTVKALPYDPAKDFLPIVLVATGGLVVIANPNAPIRTLADVVAFDKRHPGKLSVATEGPVAGTILTYLNEVLGTKIVQIPHVNASLALQDTMAGRTELSVASIVLSLPFIKNGQVRPIAVATTRRDPSLPDVPTIGETTPGFGVNAWTMLVAPAGTAPEVVERMNAEVNRILKEPEVVQWMLQFGNRAEGGSTAAAASFVRTDAALWERIARTAGVKPQ
jgi:tripartite-type tricarboxylate transporter receptor subunit TctC